MGTIIRNSLLAVFTLCITGSSVFAQSVKSAREDRVEKRSIRKQHRTDQEQSKLDRKQMQMDKKQRQRDRVQRKLNRQG